jgi:hypothetical protein
VGYQTAVLTPLKSIILKPIFPGEMHDWHETSDGSINTAKSKGRSGFVSYFSLFGYLKELMG